MTTPAASYSEKPNHNNEQANTAAGILSCWARRPYTLTNFTWLLYDDTGSQIFEDFTQDDDYYLTRLERGIFEKNSIDIISQAVADNNIPLRIVELGAGTATKTGILLTAAVQLQQSKVDYIPIDVSSIALSKAKLELERLVPSVCITPKTCNFVKEPLNLPSFHGCTLVLLIGSTISSFTLEEASGILEGVRSRLQPNDAFLLGVDMVKDPSVILRAYGDVKGHVGAFLLNLLYSLNRDFGYNFNIDQFRHRVMWNEDEERIEGSLESLSTQQVQCKHHPKLSINFEKGDLIHTINSYKYTMDKINYIFSKAGFTVERIWPDEKKWYSVVLARVTDKFK